MADDTLKQSVDEFLDRMEDITTRLHNAIEDGDPDAQHAALAAIIGLVEMLKGVAENHEAEPDDPVADA